MWQAIRKNDSEAPVTDLHGVGAGGERGPCPVQCRQMCHTAESKTQTNERLPTGTGGCNSGHTGARNNKMDKADFEGKRLYIVIAASMLYFNGVDSVSISKRLGHAQVSTTANIYAHDGGSRPTQRRCSVKHLFEKGCI